MAQQFWYKDSIIYAIDIPSFQDGNGDGIGDFRGATSRIDYLAQLGFTRAANPLHQRHGDLRPRFGNAGLSLKGEYALEVTLEPYAYLWIHEGQKD